MSVPLPVLPYDLFKSREVIDLPFYNVRTAPFSAQGDGITDDTAAIQAAIDSLPAAGGDIVLPVGRYKVSSSLILKSNVTLRGVQSGIGAGQGVVDQGSSLLWYGSTADEVIRIVDANDVRISGLLIDLRSIASVTGILLDATVLNIGANNNIVERCSILNIGANSIGIQWGTSGVAPGYQNDGTTIRENKFRGVSSGGSRGIVTNSSNACQYSEITRNLFQLLDIALELQVQGGLLRIAQNAFGSNVTCDIKDSSQADAVFECNQGEGGTRFLHLTGGLNIGITKTLISNKFDEPVLVDTGRRIVSIGNYGAAAATSTHASTLIVSINEYVNSGTGWTMTAGKIQTLDVTLAPATLVVVANGQNDNCELPASPIAATRTAYLGGASGAFSTTGFTNGSDGQRRMVFNATGQAWTIKHLTGSAAGNQIFCPTGVDIVAGGFAVVEFIYFGPNGYWLAKV